MGTRLCIATNEELKKEILDEVQSLAYAMHYGRTKMYRILQEHYWWRRLKMEFTYYVSKFMVS